MCRPVYSSPPVILLRVLLHTFVTKPKIPSFPNIRYFKDQVCIHDCPILKKNPCTLMGGGAVYDNAPVNRKKMMMMIMTRCDAMPHVLTREREVGGANRASPFVPRLFISR